VFVEEARTLIEDLDSDSGTSVNGRMLAQTFLTEGDEVAVGNSILRFSDIPGSQECRLPDVSMIDGDRNVLGVLHRGRGDATLPDEVSKTPLLRLPRRNIAALQVIPGEDTHVEAYEAILGKMKEGYFARDREARLPASRPVTQMPLERENQLLHRICSLGQAIETDAAEAASLDDTLHEILDAFECDTASVLVRSTTDESWEIRACASALGEPESITVSRRVVEQAVDEGISVLSVHELSDEDWNLGRHGVSEGITTSICSPFPVEGQLAGMLIVERRNRHDPLRATDLRVATAAGSVLGLVLNAEKSEDRARTKERLATIGEVVCGLGHHTKNLVHALNLGLRNLERAVAKEGAGGLDHYVKTISEVQLRLQDTVLDMLSYSKPRVPCKVCVDVETSLNNVLNPFREDLREQGVDVEILIEPTARTVWADQRAIERVFSNLLGNSFDALDRKDGGDKSVRVTASSNSNRHEMTIIFRDTGCGIPKEKLTSIFEAFYSTKGSCGTGLGLAVSKKVAEEHGGQLTVSSVEKEWTEFLLTLPNTAPSPEDSV